MVCSMWLEFGVHTGGTITHTGNWKLTHCPKDSGLVHGFDTFTGLPEDWGPGYQKVDPYGCCCCSMLTECTGTSKASPVHGHTAPDDSDADDSGANLNADRW